MAGQGYSVSGISSKESNQASHLYQETTTHRKIEKTEHLLIREETTERRPYRNVQVINRERESGLSPVLPASNNSVFHARSFNEAVHREVSSELPEIFLQSPVTYRYWNDLPQDVVDAPSVNAFKNRLDKTWADVGT